MIDYIAEAPTAFFDSGIIPSRALARASRDWLNKCCDIAQQEFLCRFVEFLESPPIMAMETW